MSEVILFPSTYTLGETTLEKDGKEQPAFSFSIPEKITSKQKNILAPAKALVHYDHNGLRSGPDENGVAQFIWVVPKSAQVDLSLVELYLQKAGLKEKEGRCCLTKKEFFVVGKYVFANTTGAKKFRLREHEYARDAIVLNGVKYHRYLFSPCDMNMVLDTLKNAGFQNVSPFLSD